MSIKAPIQGNPHFSFMAQPIVFPKLQYWYLWNLIDISLWNNDFLSYSHFISTWLSSSIFSIIPYASPPTLTPSDTAPHPILSLFQIHSFLLVIFLALLHHSFLNISILSTKWSPSTLMLCLHYDCVISHPKSWLFLVNLPKEYIYHWWLSYAISFFMSNDTCLYYKKK